MSKSRIIGITIPALLILLNPMVERGVYPAQDDAPSPPQETEREEPIRGVPISVARAAILEELFPVLSISHWSKNPESVEFVYGDVFKILHHVVSTEDELKELWRSIPVNGNIREVFVEDLEGDGSLEVITFTTGARIYIWNLESYRLLWESVTEEFKSIQAMQIANVDGDDALELIVCADNRIHYYDGRTYFRERVARDEINPTRMLVADVDGDQYEEIITTDGFVIDTMSLTIDWSTEHFGYPWYLADINRDGTLDLVAEVNGAIRLWDVRNRREVW